MRILLVPISPAPPKKVTAVITTPESLRSECTYEHVPWILLLMSLEVCGRCGTYLSLLEREYHADHGVVCLDCRRELLGEEHDAYLDDEEDEGEDFP